MCLYFPFTWCLLSFYVLSLETPPEWRRNDWCNSLWSSISLERNKSKMVVGLVLVSGMLVSEGCPTLSLNGILVTINILHILSVHSLFSIELDWHVPTEWRKWAVINILIIRFLLIVSGWNKHRLVTLIDEEDREVHTHFCFY